MKFLKEFHTIVQHSPRANSSTKFFGGILYDRTDFARAKSVDVDAKISLTWQSLEQGVQTFFNPLNWLYANIKI
jgi:hypothetical protein